jgi:hypothetical protein
VSRAGRSLADRLATSVQVDSGKPLLAFSDVVLRFEGVTAIDDVSFDV